MALGLPLLLLIWLQGWSGLLATMARFFTQVALLSFGGAYAVLPFVSQGAVSHYGWLQPAQMLDGLALGETTPGPLIMVVAFVGFMGGWNASGALGLAWLAGLVVVWFTFLPSFAFILIGAHLVEANAITPLIVGHRLTINPIMILISLSFWGWVWGTPGALLAVPLLIILQTVIGAAGKPDIAGFLFEHGTLDQQRRRDERASRGDSS